MENTKKEINTSYGKLAFDMLLQALKNPQLTLKTEETGRNEHIFKTIIFEFGKMRITYDLTLAEYKIYKVLEAQHWGKAYVE